MPNNRSNVYDYGYFDDNSVEWVASLTEAVAVAGKFQPAGDAAKQIPQKCVMRHVGLVSKDKKKTAQLKISIAANANFVSGGEVDFDGQKWDVVGKTGELWFF